MKRIALLAALVLTAGCSVVTTEYSEKVEDGVVVATSFHSKALVAPFSKLADRAAKMDYKWGKDKQLVIGDTAAGIDQSGQIEPTLALVGLVEKLALMQLNPAAPAVTTAIDVAK